MNAKYYNDHLRNIRDNRKSYADMLEKYYERYDKPLDMGTLTNTEKDKTGEKDINSEGSKRGWTDTRDNRETLRRGTELAKVQAQGRNQRANTRLKHALEDDVLRFL